MQCRTIFKLKLIGMAIAGLGASSGVWAEEAADAVTTQKIEVISTTPLPLNTRGPVASKIREA